jgi:probable rRNA maturation factor
MVTCDRDMREINYSCRGVDMTTDVLSFPMHYLVPGNFEVAADAADRETGLFLLGDIVLSAERVILQAQEYGRTKKQETAYLTVHSVLHLLGYDHMDEAEDKRKMRGREKEIMRRLGMQEE